MKKMVENITSTLTTCMKKDILARRSQLFSKVSGDCNCLAPDCREALKKDIVAMIEETKARITKKCPNCPGSKCSPSNFIIVV